MEELSQVSRDELERTGMKKDNISRLLTASNMLKSSKAIAVY